MYASLKVLLTIMHTAIILNMANCHIHWEGNDWDYNID